MSEPTDDLQLRPAMRLDAGLLSREAATRAAGDGSYESEELVAALGRVESLAREVEQLERSLRSQQESVGRLRESLQVVEGRSLRHEASGDRSREFASEIDRLEEQLTQEVSLRRDLGAEVQRAGQRESEIQHELQRVLQEIATRLDDFDGRVSAESHRLRAAAEGLADVEHGELDLVGRLERVEHRLGAELEAGRHQGTEVARLAAALSQLASTVDEIDARARAIRFDQQRVDEEISRVRALRDREAELLEVIEQQRATRARLEDRVSNLEEQLAAFALEAAEDRETGLRLRQAVQGEGERRRALEERIEAQRDGFLEHLRRQARTDEEAHRRQIDDLERGIRASRELLVRLSETADEADREPPL